jgi:Tol biopolymer transport system component
VRDCLVRDPKQRLRDIGDARLALDKIAAGGSDDAVRPAVAAVSSPAWRRALPWAVAAVCALSAVWLWAPWRSVTVPAETRVDIVTPPTTQPASFALSPDGRQVVFVASDDKASRLWVRSLATTTAQPLAGTEGATFPFWSPDGKSLGFFAGGSLRRRDLDGGEARILAPATNGNGGTWNTDNVIVFAPSSTVALMRVPANGGPVTAATTLGPQQFGHVHPQFLPDGRRLLFLCSGSADVAGIYLGGLDGRPSVKLSSDISSGLYLPPGWLLWARAGSLTAQRLDVERAALTGEPVTLTDGIRSDFVGTRIPVSVAATGLVAYRTTGGGERQLTWFDRSGAPRGVVGAPDSSIIQPRVSPDGRRVAVARTVQGNQDIWLIDGARESRLTFDPSPDRFPEWSPDGTRIVYQAIARGNGDLYQKLTSGAGQEEPFLTTGHLLTPSSWSRDGRFLLHLSIDPATNSDLWVLPTTGSPADRKPFVFLKTPFREAYGVFSPDGRWVAYHSNETGRPEVYVRPFVPPSRDGSVSAAVEPSAGATVAGAGQWQVSTAGGILPLWSADGKELYYIDPDGAMMAAPIKVSVATVEPGAPVRLFMTRIFGGGADIQSGRQYDVTADGRFLIATLLNEAAVPITLLQNWNPAAKR